MQTLPVLSSLGNLLVGSVLFLLSGVAYSQTSVERFDASALPDNTVVYTLPQTKLAIPIVVKKTVTTVGPLHLYAQKYLGITDAASQPSTKYELEAVSLQAYGVPNPDLRYSVKFRNGSSAPFVYLTRDGILCSINAEAAQTEAIPSSQVLDESKQLPTAPRAMSQEYVQATTDAQRAEIAAKEIFRLRESRINIVSGDAEQPFPDGQAMKLAIEGLEAQERTLTSKFTGTTHWQRRQEVVTDLPLDSATTIVAFRFSPDLGVLPAEDLRGEPIYLQTEVVEKAPALTEKEAARKAKKLKGVVYTIPGRMKASLIYKGSLVARKMIDVAQLGTQEALEPDHFNTRKETISILFYPDTGAVSKVQGGEK